MKVEELVGLKKISVEEYEIYMLFHASESGRMWLENKTRQTFMETPIPQSIGEASIFNEGRRSLLREIIYIIDKIHELVRTSDDNTTGKYPESQW